MDKDTKETDKTFTVGHPFYFPTQVILLDDDPDFLEGVSLMLSKNLSFKIFQSANQALDYVNNANKHVKIQERCYSNYKTGPMESDSLSHIDIDKLHLEVMNGSRFQTASTVIVDYSMPEMNGLEFLLKVKNPFIKKVLLTGQADTELAIKAFNKQLIDQFIDKHDPKLRIKLNSIIATFQDQYFRNSFKLITDPIIANNRDAFLIDSQFQDFFQDLRDKYNCVEYYMVDSPNPGFLLIDDKGKRYNLAVLSTETLGKHIKALQAFKAPKALIEKLKSAELFPKIIINGEEETMPAELVNEWEKYYLPALKITNTSPFYVAFIADNDPASMNGKNIITYSDFLEANTMNNEILH